MKKHYSVQYETGDIVFTCIGAALFGQISTASQCWSNHVGIIIGHNGDDYLVAESRVPLNRHHAVTVYTTFSWTTLRGSSPVRRSAVEQKLAIMEQVPARLNKFYHTGFKYESSRQFC